MPDKIKPPSKTLLKKYKNNFKKAVIKEMGFEKIPSYMSQKQFDIEVAALKKTVDDMKYDDKSLVFFVSKNFPEDKFYKELREKQKFNFKNILKYFGL